MTKDEQDQLIAKWRLLGSPEIPLRVGLFVGDLEKFLDHCAKTGDLPSILKVVQYLNAYNSNSPLATYFSRRLSQRTN